VTLFQVLVVMLFMAGPKAGHDSVNDAPHDESLQYADQVLIMMLITMLRMNDDDGPDIEHLVNSNHAYES
jgi:hypothetical protein